MSTRSRSLRILAQMLGALLVVGGGIGGVAPTRAEDNGHIYVALRLPPQIVRVDDMTGAGLITLGTPGAGAKRSIQPVGIFVDGASRIYIMDASNAQIVRVNDMMGTGWTTLGSPGTGVNQFHDPHGDSGIFMDGAGRIYVADSGNSRIVRVNDMTGAGWTTLGSPGTGVNQFNHPAAIFVDGAGRIYVADRPSPEGGLNNSRIVRVNDMMGTGWTTLGSPGTGVNQFDAPTGIFVEGAGRIYVADWYNNRIVRVNDMKGAGWTILGSRGSGVNQFIHPGGIFVDGAGRIYVADSGNSRIVRVNDMTGAGWTTLHTPGVINFVFVR